MGDILTAVEKIDRYIEGLDRERFLNDEKTIDAVVRNFEIIGEATRQLPVEYTKQYPDIPWGHMIGLRNRIVHEYFGLDLDLIWEIVKSDLPGLREQIARLE
ncbi:MAG: DUF86 domain-containing protein [Caldilineaceae bacterium]|nr:DUF86 domain-containing protein [Caldilineaceae bacterium]